MLNRDAYSFVCRCAFALGVTLLGAGLAFGQEEETNHARAALSVSSRVPAAAAKRKADIPALVISDDLVTPAKTDVQMAEASPSAGEPAAGKALKYFPYTVRSGDSIGTIAKLFGVPVSEIARLNHLSEDDELLAGETLKIPNPFEAERKALEARLEDLAGQIGGGKHELDQVKAQVLSLTGRNADLVAENSALKQEAKALPWWRDTAFGMLAAALLMLGVTVLTLFEWWSLRAGFVTLSGLAQALGHLDLKYKEMLAKAELRMQQLYGRRRPASSPESTQYTTKTPEEIDIERLNQDLRQTLEAYLERLGARRTRRKRSRWGEAFSGEEQPPVEARSLRH